MANQDIVSFIMEARRRGFNDKEIKNPLLTEGWKQDLVEEAFAYVDRPVRSKICLYLDDEILVTLEKRAKRNLFSIEKQIEDILRRSVANKKKTSPQAEKLDDMLVSLFSRKKTGKTRK